MTTLDRPSRAPYFVTGGTLPVDAGSYVVRQADRDLLDGLLNGEFCYVLDTRQVGKSSMMIRTASLLERAGVRVVVLDLTRLGQSLSPEQWYYGLLLDMAGQLGLRRELREFWLANKDVGPLQRWLQAVVNCGIGHWAGAGKRSGAGPETGADERGGRGEHGEETAWQSNGAAERQSVDAPSSDPGTQARRPLVVFVDEIDAVRSLPFSADEFFAGIREIHNRRAREPELRSVTFCLLGVATPADLITDVRAGPFNIGRRIEVHDFTPAEAKSLATGFQPSGHPHGRTDGGATSTQAEVLDRVLYWTGGHPYLTQRLCQALADEAAETAAAQGGAPNPQWVDRLCDRLFLSAGGRETDDNLAFVRNRLTRSEADLASVLDLYRRVWSGKPVKDDETNHLVGVLRLAGVVRSENRQLKLRNRIYERVFDRAWILDQMPNAELRRQRAAYRQGLLRGGAVAVAFAVLGIVSLINYAEKRTSDARREETVKGLARESGERDRSDRKARELRRTLYVEALNLAQEAANAGDFNRSLKALAAMDPGTAVPSGAHERPIHEELRGFEWRYYWRLAQLGIARPGRLPADARYRVHRVGTSPLLLASFLTDSRQVAVAQADGRMFRWEHDTGTTLEFGGAGTVSAMVWCANRRVIAVGGRDGRIRLVPDRPGRPGTGPDGSLVLRGPGPAIQRLSASKNGRRLAALCADNSLEVWDVEEQRQVLRLAPLDRRVVDISLEPEGVSLAVACREGPIRIYDAASGQRDERWTSRYPSPPTCIAFARHGQWIASGHADGAVILWQISTKRSYRTMVGHRGPVTSLAFATDGKSLASGGADGTVRLWKHIIGEAVGVLKAPGRQVLSLAFSPDSTLLAAGRQDGTVTSWAAVSPAEASIRPGDPNVAEGNL